GSRLAIDLRLSDQVHVNEKYGGGTLAKCNRRGVRDPGEGSPVSFIRYVPKDTRSGEPIGELLRTRKGRKFLFGIADPGRLPEDLMCVPKCAKYHPVGLSWRLTAPFGYQRVVVGVH